MRTVTLIKIKPGDYTDQYGFKHKCMKVVDQVEAIQTGQTVAYEYYTETIQDPIYQSMDGRTFRCHIATDYGCGNTWSEMEKERVLGEHWCELKDKEELYYWIDLPVIRE